MLTEKEETLLDQAFGKQELKELTQQQSAKIASRTNIPLRAVEYFALGKGYLPRRYRENIGTLGTGGQRKLLENKVIIFGLGGLGGYVLEELARVGLGQIIGVDPDVVDETNLNRQLLAEEGNLGSKKVNEANNRLRKVNKAVEFAGHAIPLDELPEEAYCNADLAFGCLDNISDRLILAKRCSIENIPLVHGAIAGWYGEVAVVWPHTGLLEKIYKHQGKSIEQNLGTPPFTAAIAASLMVVAGIRILLGKSSDKEQKMLFFDLLENEWQTITF